MTERIALLVLLVVFVGVGVAVARTWSRRQTLRLQSAEPADVWTDLGEQPDGRATVVSFSTPSCAACHTAQSPALDMVERQLGTERVRVVRIDASQQPGVARAFGILTVPSTIVLDPSGRVANVNHGFVASGRLVQQLQQATIDQAA